MPMTTDHTPVPVAPVLVSTGFANWGAGGFAGGGGPVNVSGGGAMTASPGSGATATSPATVGASAPARAPTEREEPPGLFDSGDGAWAHAATRAADAMSTTPARPQRRPDA